jgi:hypothetical protein
VEPYIEEFATERTAKIITAFMAESRPVIPASLMAIMNGDVLEATSLTLTSSGLLEGTMRPIIAMETM